MRRLKGKSEFIMNKKRNSNLISIIHRLVTDEYGENYWFNGCASYLMECLGEPDYDYWFFAGITGDLFTQHYKFNFPYDAVSAYHCVYGDKKYFEDIFAKCGYFAEVLLNRDVSKNKEIYLQKLMLYIDKGIPVITLGTGEMPESVYIGYEDCGKTLLYVSGNSDTPKRISCDKAMESGIPDAVGFIFAGEKKEDVPLAKIYRDAIFALPELLSVNNDKYCLGAAAFRKWADDIDRGIFDNISPDEFEIWGMYQNFVCVLATNGSCCYGFLNKAQELNPDMTFLEDVSRQYRITQLLWNAQCEAVDEFAECIHKYGYVTENLESLGGGFNVTLEVLQNKEKRAKITSTLLKFADVTDEITNILKNGLKKINK